MSDVYDIAMILTRVGGVVKKRNPCRSFALLDTIFLTPFAFYRNPPPPSWYNWRKVGMILMKRPWRRKMQSTYGRIRFA
ncbi:hypothetical protein F2P81_010059 [Scophthalmus maximus]|uniref:Uncharacterized protein n=1 Tax=Scophthalmus maximus TaxID=52904 RepID=A0A6A4SWT7_SCOMX|nr:hypothetical protein F2P81_010059 [Scophthalmus maximus]